MFAGELVDEDFSASRMKNGISFTKKYRSIDECLDQIKRQTSITVYKTSECVRRLRAFLVKSSARNFTSKSCADDTTRPAYMQVEFLT